MRGTAPHQRAAARDTSTTAEEQVERSKYDVGVPTRDLSAKIPKDLPAGYGKDRVVVMVRDPYWLHAYWELTARPCSGRGRPRAGVAHVAPHPAPARRQQPRHDQHGRVDRPRHRDPRGLQQLVHRRQQPPRSYRIDIGYLARSGRFYVLARSNVVSTPRAGVSDVIDENWSDIDSSRPTASTPCRPASTRPPAAWS